MSSSSRYRVSFHVSHSHLSADEICAAFPLKPRYARTAGEPKTTIRGIALDGVHSRTDVSFPIGQDVVLSDDVSIAEFIAKALNELPLCAIEDVISSGGSCFFFVGIYTEENLLFDLTGDLLSQLGDNRIGLKLDFYGGPGP